jgi:aminomethyltransferase
MKRTPFNSIHHSLGAKMVPFAGFEMPIMYSGIIEEHMAVRERAGLFDVSHMGDLIISGKGVEAKLNHILTNDISNMPVGKGMYAHILNDDGKIIDDTIVYRLAAESYLMVPNASTKDIVLKWIVPKLEGLSILDRSEQMACLALQGPRAQAILQPLSDVDLSEIKRFRFMILDLNLGSGACNLDFVGGEAPAGRTRCIVARTGYTGEDGFEIIFDSSAAEAMWKRLMSIGKGVGLQPTGLGCRDTLRLEMGYLLSGTDFDGSQTSLQTGPPWVVKLDHEFIGRDALIEQQKDEYDVLVGIAMEGKGIPRHGYDILHGGDVVGTVTSGTMSPILKSGIAMGYVPRALAEEGTKVQIDIRGRGVDAVIKVPPFIR